jgi:DNA-binding transcriptional ArsR family regulator
MSFAAVAKHVHILHKAGLVSKIRVGREQAIEADIKTLEYTRELLESYEKLWIDRL